MIELHCLSKAYDSVLAVQDLTLDVERGELLVHLGGFGCGKKTTLKLINRLVDATAGAVRIAGTDTRALEGHEGRIGAEAMRQMNLQVDQDGQLPRAVAEQFLEREPIQQPSPLRGSIREER